MTRRRFSELRRTPWLLLAQKAVRRIPLRPLDLGKLCFLRLDRIPRVRSELLRGPGTVRRGTVADLEALVALRDQRSVFVKRFAAGDRCVIAEIDGRIVAVEWWSSAAVHQETAWGYRIDIPSRFVYAYDAYIDPRYRNSGIWLRFKAYLGEQMTAEGQLGVLTFVEYGNWPSWRTHLRFGFKPDLEVVVIKIAGKLLVRPSEPSCRPDSQLAGLPVR
jgi:GNAT superfamily N-acetyltransferase